MISWIDTRYARPYKSRKALASVTVATIYAAGMGRLSLIIMGRAPMKVIAIAQCVTRTHASASKAIREITMNDARVGVITHD